MLRIEKAGRIFKSTTESIQEWLMAIIVLIVKTTSNVPPISLSRDSLIKEPHRQFWNANTMKFVRHFLHNTMNGFDVLSKLILFIWLFNGYDDFSELTDEMRLLDEDNEIKNLQIGPHKYLYNKGWACTINACRGSIRVVGNRYAETNPHNCNAEDKQRKLNEVTERRRNQVWILFFE